MTTEPEGGPPQPADGVVCPKCLLHNAPGAAFCSDCGAPIGMVAAIDPIQHIYAEGFAYRSAVEGPPNLVVLIGMWLIFVPIAFASAVVAFGSATRGLSPRLLFVFFVLCSVVILFRSTKNYVVKSLAVKNQKT